jgi:chromatin modification-related protein EAF6
MDDRRRGRLREEDRVFSRSSVAWMKLQEGPESNTPSHAPTPTGSVAPQLSRADTAASTPGASGVKAPGNKKKRPTEKDDEDEGKPSKRGKISYSRE